MNIEQPSQNNLVKYIAVDLLIFAVPMLILFVLTKTIGAEHSKEWTTPASISLIAGILFFFVQNNSLNIIRTLINIIRTLIVIAVTYTASILIHYLI